MASSPFRHAPFRWLMAGRTVNSFGNSIAPIALAFAVLDLTHSATDLGIVVASRSLTNVALVLFGGVIADRLPKRLLMVGAALSAAVTQGAVAGLVLSGSATVWSLAVLSAFNGAFSAVSFPASSSLIPLTVPAEDLQKANGFLRLSVNAINVVGISVGALLVGTFGPGYGILIDATTFLFAGVFFSRVRVDHVPKTTSSTILADLREGFSEVASRSWVLIVIIQFCIVNAAESGANGILGPVVADQTFGRKAYGVVLAANTVGLVIGSVIAIRVKPKRALLVGTFCCLGLVLPPLALATFPNVPVLIVAFFVAALGLDVFSVGWDLSLQENVPPDRLARVYSYDALGSFLAIPVGEIVVGPLSKAIGVKETLYLCAAGVFLPTVAALFAKSIRTLERRVPEPEIA